MNTNCLEGVKCPACGHEDRFFINAQVLVQVTDDGTEDQGGDYMWDENSYCRCGDCGKDGVLKDFIIVNS